jgi:type I restriction enzyme M protein
MSNTSSQIVQKLWSYCNVLRDDGLSYGDYTEQLTFLLFLKMAHERTQPPWKRSSIVPAGLDWPALMKKDGEALEAQYRKTLEELGKKKGMLGIIFRKEQKKHLDHEALHGVEIVDAVTRLCAMNLMLHGIGPDADEADPPVETGDSLAADPGRRYHVVLTNPPFGKKSSVMVVTEDGDEDRQALTVTREDFWARTSNKQLNFVQHVKALLEIHGRAAVVVPDNVLFEGGAGETVRRRLLHDCDVHTLLRLPTGIFYAQGVKANVLFFDRKPASATPWTKKLWIYDLRTNQHFTLKTNPLKRRDLDELVECYRPEARQKRKATWSEQHPTGRWRAYEYAEIVQRDKCSLDLFWLKDESLEASENLPEPDVIAGEIVEDLRAALAQFEEVASDLCTD